MPAHSKGLTWTFKARLTESEERAVRGAVAEYKESGITISLNDAIRILVRRGARPLPRTLGPLEDRIAEHDAECEWCSPETTCPEMRRMGHARRCLTPEPAPRLPGADEYTERMGRAAAPGVVVQRPPVRRLPGLPGGGI